MRGRTTASAAALALIIGCLATSAPAAASVACAGPGPGGDWPTYGHDLANTRDQGSEHTLGPAQAATLAPAWTFYTGEASGVTAGNLSDLNATPIEQGGCVYFGTGATKIANVFALNAVTGALVWSRHLDAGAGALGGAVPGSLAYSHGTVFALVNRPGDGIAAGPYVVALEARTGSVRWQSSPITTTAGDYTNASPVVGDGVVLAGFSATEGSNYGHGGLGILSATTGRLLRVTYTVPPSQWGTPAKPAYAGGGVWTAPAIDARHRYAYYGTGNPFSKQAQYPTTDAIVKLDLNRRHRTFGQIVAFHSGNIDQFLSVVKTVSQPTCQLLPNSPFGGIPAADPRLQELQGVLANSPGCVQLDLDFGAAPNLFTDSRGRLVVGDLQKSGIYHAAFASDMKSAWYSLIGASCQVCNGASTALDPGSRSIFADVSPGSLMTTIGDSAGKLQWTSPIGDGFHYESVSTADGVIYTMDGLGFFDVIDARTGVPLARRSLALDAGTDALPPDGYNSSGVAIARHTVYVEAGSHVVAYRAAAPVTPLG